MFEYDATGVSVSAHQLLPDGWFPFEIFDTEVGVSKSGHMQVLVKAACIDPKFKDQTVWHWVTFLPNTSKGAFIAIHFLKCIDQPHEGKIAVEAEAWKRKRFMAKVYLDKYNGKTNNKFSEISKFREDYQTLQEPEPAPAAVSVDDSIPF